MTKPAILICGPTAIGKSDLALALAKAYGGEIISADSMQVYRGMDIATAKPSAADLRAIPHHMISCIDAVSPYNAALYARDAMAAYTDIMGRGRRAIVCGGTGLYLDALLYGIDGDAQADAALRQELSDFLQEHGAHALHERLRVLDAAVAEQIHPNNAKRVIRAIERILSGDSLEAHPVRTPRFPYMRILLRASRALLNARIDMRVDAMLEQGLEEEARALRPVLAQSATAVYAIGHKELYPYFDGLCSRQEAVENLKRATRRYAKRQETWFRRYTDAHVLDVSQFAGPDELLRAALHTIEEEEKTL